MCLLRRRLIPGLGRPLEKGMATHSSILAWRILWTKEPGGLWSMGSQRVGQTEAAYMCVYIYISPKYIGFPGGTSGKEKSESCTVVSDSLEPHGL